MKDDMLRILRDVELLLEDIRIRHSHIVSREIFNPVENTQRDVAYFIDMGEYAVSRLEEEEKILETILDGVRECLAKTKDDHTAVKKLVRGIMRKAGYRWRGEGSIFDYGE